MTVRNLNQIESAQKNMQVGVDVTCMYIPILVRVAFSISEILLLSKKFNGSELNESRD